MKDETKKWLKFSDENFAIARWTLENKLFNACLQNVQQSVEKNLKGLILEFSEVEEYDELLPRQKYHTHLTIALKSILGKNGINIDITDEECRQLDLIYIPSKYPAGSAWPNYDADEELCNRFMSAAEKAVKSVKKIIEQKISSKK